MVISTRSFFLLLIIVSAFSAKAENDSLVNKSGNKVYPDSLTEHSSVITSSSKICSCQILDMQSSNYRHRNYALLAERTNVKGWNYDLNKINNKIKELFKY